MARVNTVQQKDHSMLVNVAKGATIGATAGYVSKYLLPVTAPEKADKKYRAAMEVIKKGTNDMKGLIIENIRNLPNKTPAQDTFIKMVDMDIDVPDKIVNLNNVEAKPDKSMYKAAKKLSLIKNLSKEDRLALKNIIAGINSYASKMYKHHVLAYEVGVTKRIRPAFVGLGACIGFVAAVANNVLKTEKGNA